MKYLIPVLLIGSLCISCSDGLVDFESDEVEGSVSEGKVTVFNKLNNSIYYFLIERETAARTYWTATSADKNQIKARSTKRISLKDIYGYEREDEILLYYWKGKDSGPGDIKHILVKTD